MGSLSQNKTTEIEKVRSNTEKSRGMENMEMAKRVVRKVN